MTGEKSGNESSGVVALLQILLDSLCIPLTVSEHFIRKLAHFSEFAVLGVLTSVTFYVYDRNFKKYIKRLLQMFFICLATAVTDETIQLFVPQRAGMVQDVLIDFSGAVTGIIIVSFICMLVYFKRVKRNKLNVAE